MKKEEKNLLSDKETQKNIKKLKIASLKKYKKEYQKTQRKRLFLTLAGVLAAGLAVIFLSIGLHSLYAKAVQKKLDAARAEREANIRDITIGCTGCMLLHDQILESYTTDGVTYDFSDIYRYIKPYYNAVDFMACEFEGALTGQDYSGYPSFHSPDQIIEDIHDAGVDLQMLATNHIYDGMSSAFHRTMDTYDSKKIEYTGIRQTVNVKPYYIAEIQDIKVGFINYVYDSENKQKEINSIPVESRDKNLINTFDVNHLNSFYQEISSSLTDMKADGADFLIVWMHWGEEYHLKEADYQDQIAQELCNMGVDAIIGGHPHCEEPIDMLTSTDKTHQTFVIYSVGNALSNQRASLIDRMPEGHTEDGVVVILNLYRDEDFRIYLKDVSLLPTWVCRLEEGGSFRYYILPLDDAEHIEETTGLTGIQKDAQKSCDRTMEVLGSGLNKVKASLS